MYDTTEQLVHDAEFCVAVLGKADSFMLVRIDAGIDERATDLAKENGFYYCGVLGLLDGKPGVQCEPNADAEVLRVLVSALPAFLDLVSPTLVQHAISRDFCERLYELPDTRSA